MNHGLSKHKQKTAFDIELFQRLWNCRRKRCSYPVITDLTIDFPAALPINMSTDTSA
jgi:hypothetical protein